MSQQVDILNHFLALHRSQLLSMGLPPSLHLTVCEKILSQSFDAGNYVCYIEPDDDEDEGEGEGEEDCFKSLKLQYQLGATSDIAMNSTVILLDHMWTTTFPQSRAQLKEHASLRERIAAALSLELSAGEDGSEEDALVDEDVSLLWDALWPHLQCYLVPEDDYTRWYMMDEVGTFLSPSFQQHPANMKCSPLLVNFPGSPPFAVSVMWPICNVAAGDILRRDYMASISIPSGTSAEATMYANALEQLWKTAFIRPTSIGTSGSISATGVVSKVTKETGEAIELGQGLEDMDMGYSEQSTQNTIYVYDSAMYQAKIRKQLDGIGALIPPAPSAAPVLHSGVVEHAWESIYHTLAQKQQKLNTAATTTPLLVYCDRPDHLNPDFLTHETHIQMVDDPVLADILYLIEHTCDDQDGEHRKQLKMTNQFWWNGMIVSKEHLARTIRNAQIVLNQHENLNGSKPKCYPWFPLCYDLSVASELKSFIGEFCDDSSSSEVDDVGGSSMLNLQNIEKEVNEKKVWILKRYRGRQSMDYPITSNLSCALRHQEAAPRLACQYLSKPALYGGRKFDLRYYVTVLSLEPLRLYRHRTFSVRVANMPYADNGKDDLEVFQKHFTVMNFLDEDEGSSSLQEIRGTGERKDPSMEEFIQVFNREHGATGGVGLSSWGDSIQPNIDRVLRELFEAVNMALPLEPPHPSGVRLNPNSAWSLNQQPNVCPARAMYGVDILLDTLTNDAHTLQPYVLEVQWAPDCGQSIDEVPTFWDDILGSLYLEKDDNMVAL